MQNLKSLAQANPKEVVKALSFRVNPFLVLFEPGFNLRIDGPELEEHVDRLRLAMLAGAFIPPVDVQVNADGTIFARDGHCRVKAAQLVRKTVPDYTLECRELRGSDADAVLHMLGTGSGQRPLSPLEQGRGFLRLINMGFNVTNMAKRLGISRPTIDKCLSLAEAPMEMQNMVASGEVSSTTLSIAIKQGPEAVEALTHAVKSERESTTKTTKKAGGSKKFAVTPQMLKGTKGEQKPKVKLKINVAPVPADEGEDDGKPILDSLDALAFSEVTIKAPRELVSEVLGILKSFEVEAPHLPEADLATCAVFASTLETALF